MRHDWEITGARARLTFDSLSDLIDTAERNRAVMAQAGRTAYVMGSRPAWYGGVSNMDEAIALAREGLPAEGIEAAAIADDAVTSVEHEYDVPSFASYYDVTGSDVDVARYLSGEPENMIAYTMVDTPKVGRVVTIVVGIATLANTKAWQIAKRGRAIMALIFALEKLGLQVEVIGNALSNGVSGRRENHYSIRTVVTLKRAGEALDPAALMFALTHAAMFRAFVIPLRLLAGTESWRERSGFNSPGGHTVAGGDPSVFGDDVINLPPIVSGKDVPDPEAFVADHLRELGLISA